MQTYYNRERKKGKHLTLVERCIIEACSFSMTAIYHKFYNLLDNSFFTKSLTTLSFVSIYPQNSFPLSSL